MNQDKAISMNQEALFVIFDNIGPFVLSFFRLLQKFKFDDKTKPWAAHRDRLLRPHRDDLYGRDSFS